MLCSYGLGKSLSAQICQAQNIQSIIIKLNFKVMNLRLCLEPQELHRFCICVNENECNFDRNSITLLLFLKISNVFPAKVMVIMDKIFYQYCYAFDSVITFNIYAFDLVF